MRVRYFEPLYGFDADLSHVATSDTAEDVLREMGRVLVGTDDLVAIYVPLGTEEAYRAGGQKGRVVGAVRLLPMPADKTIRDYFHLDLDGSMRWPIGWPCEVAFAPPTEQCPMLRSLVDKLHGANAYQPYTAQFHKGPFRIDPKMAAELKTWFDSLPRHPGGPLAGVTTRRRR